MTLSGRQRVPRSNGSSANSPPPVPAPRVDPPPSVKSTAPVAASGSHACTRTDCDRTFATGQARAMHERRAHDGFDPKAAKAG